ncbi:MAG: iron ABC transporter permease [Pseudomonadota bacterium]
MYPGTPYWLLGTAIIALPIAVPIIAVLATFFSPAGDVWQHLRSTVLPSYVVNTVVLLVWVAVISGVVGVGCAWLVASRDFPGRRLFTWALILPFATPAYVVAYAYADFLDYSGPLQSALRELSLLEGALPSIRSMPGACLVLGFVLYPYVYLLAYTAFAHQSRPLCEAAQTLGAQRTPTFFRIALPMARPAIAGGLMLALMEAAADFGVVEFYGVPTLTNGIFRTWYAQGEHQAALQMAGWLFVIVAMLVVFEQLSRRGLHSNPVSRDTAAPLAPIVGSKKLVATLLCSVPLILGFLLPVSILAYQAWTTGDPLLGTEFSRFTANSVWVGSIAAVLATLAAMCLAYAGRMADRPGTKGGIAVRVGIRTATLGYALPGMVLAMGLIGPLTGLDKWLAHTLNVYFDMQVGLLITGSVALLVFVYLARFMAVAFNSCESGLKRVHSQYDDAARSLGARPREVLMKVHVPLMLPSLSVAFLLVFIDVIKELPATLILRPFNFETLATRAYRLASDERLAEASTASLSILLVGLVPTILLAMQTFKRRH